MRGAVQQIVQPKDDRAVAGRAAGYAATPDLDRLIEALTLAVARRNLRDAQAPALTPDTSQI